MTVRLVINRQAALPFGELHVAIDGLVQFVGMDGFGASAPYKELYQHFGITADAVVTAATSRLDGAEADASS